MSDVSQSVRTKLYIDMNGRCFYCAMEVRIDGEHELERDWLLLRTNNLMTADHVDPKVRGGKDGYKNRVCACYSCNAAKGSLNLDEFRFVKMLRGRDFNFSFCGEGDPNIRDWMLVYSDDQARELFVHNYPDAAKHYSRGRGRYNSWWSRRK